MPWKPTDPTFDDGSHEPIRYYSEAVNEPISPATTTNGATVQLYDTPESATEYYRAPRSYGPAAARIELKIAAGAWQDASSGIAVGGVVGTEHSLQMRVVALPYAGSGDNPQCWFPVYVADSGEADWLG